MVWTPMPFERTSSFDQHFVARPELQEISRWWAADAREPLVLVGAAGAGMTWLIRALARSVPVSAEALGTVVVLPGFVGLRDPEGALHSSAIQHRGIFLFEDVDELAPMRYPVGFISMLRQMRPRFGVAVASRPDQADSWPSHWPRLQLQSLTNVGSLMLLQQLDRDATIGQLHGLAVASQGAPQLLRVLAGLPQDESVDEVLRRTTPQELLELFPAPALPLGDDLFPGTEREALRELDIRMCAISQELIRRLSENPDLLYRLRPRQLEELMAELYQRQGCEVELTQQTHDHGVDLYVVSYGPFGKAMTLVDTKRNRHDRPVGVGVVRHLYGVVEAKRATAGVVATTSFFTAQAKSFQEAVRFRLGLHDYFDLRAMLKQAATPSERRRGR